MKWPASALVAISLLIPSLTAAGVDTGEYRDDFGHGGYSGNDGNLEFSRPWVEFGDDGGAGTGFVHIGSENCSNNQCLHLEGPGTLAASLGVERPADLSRLVSPRLTFDVYVDPIVAAKARLHVQGSDGAKWVDLLVYDLSSGFSGSKTVELTGMESPEFSLRFVVPGLVDGDGALFGGYIAIDRVAITGLLAPSTTTTTTPKPTTTEPVPTTTRPRPANTSSTTSTIPTSTSTTTPGPGTSPPPADSELSDAQGPRGTDDESLPTSTSTTSTLPDNDQESIPVLGASPPAPPPNSGLRVLDVGVLADYQPGMMGDMAMDEPRVLGADVSADFTMFVEVFDAARVWVAALALMIVAAAMAGVDRHGRLGTDPVVKSSVVGRGVTETEA